MYACMYVYVGFMCVLLMCVYVCIFIPMHIDTVFMSIYSNSVLHTDTAN